MHLRILIKDATLVSERRRFVGSLVIDDERIDEILEGEGAEPLQPVDEVIDARGCYLLPGVIDDHVHFRDPGLTQKATFCSESKAAAAGGVTTVLDMPNTMPQTTTPEALEEKMAVARSKSVVNYGLFYGATGANAADLCELNPRRVAGVKLFMGASTGGMLVENEENLHMVFEGATTAGLPVMTHCEDSREIAANLLKAQEAYGIDPPVEMHSVIRSREACVRSTMLAIKLARETNARLHIAHISTADELALIPPSDSHITAEACVGYLLFSTDEYRRLGARIKVNPAIKTPHDREALRKALTDGRIRTIGTDHAPHLISDKMGGCCRAASGMPMVQFGLLSMLDLCSKGVLELEDLVCLMAHNPAELFSIENRGYLREGYMADLVVVKPHAPWTLTPDRIQSLCNWSPLEGHTFGWRVERTFVNGFPIFNRGHITDEKYRGRAICYNR